MGRAELNAIPINKANRARLGIVADLDILVMGRLWRTDQSNRQMGRPQVERRSCGKNFTSARERLFLCNTRPRSRISDARWSTCSARVVAFKSCPLAESRLDTLLVFLSSSRHGTCFVPVSARPNLREDASRDSRRKCSDFSNSTFLHVVAANHDVGESLFTCGWAGLRARSRPSESCRT